MKDFIKNFEGYQKPTHKFNWLQKSSFQSIIHEIAQPQRFFSWLLNLFVNLWVLLDLSLARILLINAKKLKKNQAFN